jgi:hypothetical protein
MHDCDWLYRALWLWQAEQEKISNCEEQLDLDDVTHNFIMSSTTRQSTFHLGVTPTKFMTDFHDVSPTILDGIRQLY